MQQRRRNGYTVLKQTEVHHIRCDVLQVLRHMLTQEDGLLRPDGQGNLRDLLRRRRDQRREV